MKKYFLIVFLPLFFTISCGFKIVNQSEISNFDISEINTSGDKRIAYKIKNRLILNANKNAKNLLSIDLQVNKIRSVKEKNIKNEITKYQINISAEIVLKDVVNNKSSKFKVSEIGDYKVSSQNLQTLNNEKKLINLMVDNLIDKLLIDIKLKINDL
tara:strand:- start:732 stop:1202 length:471 start_codon:yes stop_codon:yes gene_type:complete